MLFTRYQRDKMKALFIIICGVRNDTIVQTTGDDLEELLSLGKKFIDTPVSFSE